MSQRTNPTWSQLQRKFADYEMHKSSFQQLNNPFAVVAESAPSQIQLELVKLQCNCNETLKGKDNSVGTAEC